VAPTSSARLTITGSLCMVKTQNRRPRIVQAQPANERQATKSAGVHGEIDDDHVRLLHPVEAKAVGQGLGLNDIVDASVFE
jgi:hypothetical protein